MADVVSVEDGYILARTGAEYDRLRAQSRAFEEATGRVLGKAGLGEGMACLDAGCGPGEVMRLMARRVGPRGIVHGLDVDRVLGEYMLADLRRTEPGRFEFHEGDVMAEASLPDATFDFVFARLLLIHMTDPVAAIERLWRRVAPGGVLCVMDYDLTTIASFPPHPAGARAGEVIRATFRASGKRADIGSHLPGLMAEAGTGKVAGTEVSGLLVPEAEAVPMIMGVLRSLAGAATKLGVIGERDLAGLLAELSALQQGSEAYFRWPLMIGAWAKKAG